MSALTSNFLVRRFAKALFTIWFVATITFFMVRAMPGNALDVMIQDLTTQGYSPQDARDRAAALLSINLNQPIHEQYFAYVGNVLRGDLGKSYRSPSLRVSDIIAAVLPWTIFSVGVSLVISFVLGIALGTIMAYTRDSWIDHVLSNLAATLEAISPYLIGLIVFLLLGPVWKLVPIAHMRGALSPGVQVGFTSEFFVDVINHVWVLVLVYVLTSVGSWMLIMKSSTVSTLGEDYVTAARARGLPDSRIITAYVGRNATLPLFTRLAIQIGFVVGGALLVESLFTYRGIGFVLAGALYERDYPIMQGVFLIITIAVVLANLLADFLYGYLDPRIRIVGEGN